MWFEDRAGGKVQSWRSFVKDQQADLLPAGWNDDENNVSIFVSSEDEFAAIQKAMGKQLPLFGCYCAGEIGPVDSLEEKKPGVLSRGSGWHVMFTVIGR